MVNDQVEKSKIGTNIRTLVIERAAQLTLARSILGEGEFGRVAGIAARFQDGGIRTDLLEATEWVKQSLAQVRAAPNNPFKTDEEIAGAILAEVEKRCRESKKRKGTK